MTGAVVAVVFFLTIGLAVSRLVGPVQPWLAGAGFAGFILYVSAFLRLPLRAVAVALFVASVLTLIVLRRRVEQPRLKYPVLPTVMTAVAAIALAVIALIVPLNDYDGRAFWLLKAKAIAHEGRVDGPFFQGASWNPRNEYPLLVPFVAAVPMLAAGELDERHSRLVFVMFAVAMALEIRRRFALRGAPAVGAWCAALLLWLPQIATDPDGSALSGYSDIALAAFTACAFFELIDATSPLRFGMWTSFVLLTKSEGLPLSFLLLLAGARVFRRNLGVLLVFYAPALMLLTIWRSWIPASDEIPFATLIFRLPQHWPELASSLGGFGEQFVALRDWGLLWVGVIAAFLMLLFRRQYRGAALAGAVVAPMIFLYASVFAVTGISMEALTGNIAPRLLTHLLGPALYVLGEASALLSRNR